MASMISGYLMLLYSYSAREGLRGCKFIRARSGLAAHPGEVDNNCTLETGTYA